MRPQCTTQGGDPLPALPLHELKEKEKYYLAMFMTGGWGLGGAGGWWLRGGGWGLDGGGGLTPPPPHPQPPTP